MKLYLLFAAILCLMLYAFDTEAACKPPKSMVCQLPPTTVQQEVRRTLNRNGMGWAWSTFSRIAYCESRWNKNATNGQYKGIFQIGDYYWGWIWRKYGWQWNDATHNTLAAIIVYKDALKLWGNGFLAWSCY